MLMRRLIKYNAILIMMWCLHAVAVQAQVRGVVIDAVSGDTVEYPNAQYRGHKVSASGSKDGQFTIARHEGWYLTVSALGYKTQRVLINDKTPESITFTMTPDVKSLDEVVVRSKRRSKYSRKNNPAVELMKRVIEAKKKTDLANHDFYQYNKYQKITLAVNDIQPDEILEAQKNGKKWFVNQVETCKYTNKLIMPISVDETVSQHLYRKNPKDERDIILGQKSKGVNQLIETGDVLNAVLKDVFTDVDIYTDQVRLLQHHFTSPISSDAINFYRFYIEDTLYIGRDQCIHLQFAPNNMQDFGFRGELDIINDSTLHVKRCSLTVPSIGGVNFIQGLKIEQEYTQLDNGEWVLTVDDMVAEMSLLNILTKALVIRTTRLSDYAFDPLPNQAFKGKAKTRYDADARIRSDEFWDKNRTVDLSQSESSMDTFIDNIEQTKGFKYLLFGIKALVENFVETGPKGSKSKFDVGPINTIVSNNFVDGLRFRASGQTTAALTPHWFWKGYYAYGTKSHKNYYSSAITYSFNKKEYRPTEFPQRTLTFTTSYDVMSPSDKFMSTDKDNVFTGIRWHKVDQMYFYNRQELRFDYETDNGLALFASMKTESNEPTGELQFNRLSDGVRVNKIRTSELMLGARFTPGRQYINTKNHRVPVNKDAPEYSFSHTFGMKHFLGGEYNYNYTEIGFYRRLWMKSWGKIDIFAKAGAQWNKVPFPLLIMPPADLSYIFDEDNFSLMKNMEFLNDRFASIYVTWDLQGKIFNRIPLLKKLKWREIIGIKAMWGTLTDKNNPFLEENAHDALLFQMPDGVHMLERDRPYAELAIGINNIFKFFKVLYVRRLSYNEIPGTKKHGVRFGFTLSF